MSEKPHQSVEGAPVSAGPTSHQIAAEDVTVTVHGPVPDGMREIAQQRVSSVTRLSGRDVLEATVTMRELANRTRPVPSRAEVMLRIPGAAVRAQADGVTLQEALDRVVDRIERRIVEQINRWNERSRWTGTTGRGQAQQGTAPDGEPIVARPPEEREVVRRKTFAITPASVDEAAYDMQALGHDFYLFTDAATGQHAVIRQRDDGGFGVSGLPDAAALPEGVRAEPAPATLTETDARHRLDVGGEPFVFYLDSVTAQGNVIYRRRDGHYGLISPA